MTVVIESSALKPETLSGKTWRVKIIEGDRQGSSAYYPKEALQEGAPLFKKGTKIYGDHPTLTEMEERPERSYRDIVGYFAEDAVYEGKDLYTSVTFIESERERIKELAEAGVIGLSIRASGDVAEGKGTRTLKKFTAVHSVDVVTEAGAGGGFTQILESAGSENPASKGDAETKLEESVEKELAEALDALVEQGKQNAAALSALAEAFKNKPKEDAEDKKDGGADEDQEDANGKKKPKAAKESLSLADLDDLIEEADLTATGRKAVLTAYEAGVPDVAPIIESEKAREAEIRESGSKPFRGNGTDTDLNESKTFSFTRKA